MYAQNIQEQQGLSLLACSEEITNVWQIRVYLCLRISRKAVDNTSRVERFESPAFKASL